jgi:diguanylate cyclase (GGDEF)-like protein
MDYSGLISQLQNLGKDPSRLIFEDELTGLYNRRFLHNYFQQNIPWDALEDNPLTLLMMDLDHFKQINDTYGHDVGDQALIWVSNLLREVSEDKYLPVRYAGDEFIIILPLCRKARALKLGERLLGLTRERTLRLPGREKEITLTLSVGIASAPDDARNEKALVQKADTALYYAKKTGRDRIANVGEIAPQSVFAKTALHQLGRAAIGGRKTALTAVAESLKHFSQKQNQFLIAEGAAGMGKTMFLDTIQRSLAQTKSIYQIKATGNPQELYRPYYLISEILLVLLRNLGDKGQKALKELSEEDGRYLSSIVPHLGKVNKEEIRDEKTYREGVFAALIKLVGKLHDGQPSIWFIDDLHYCDEATLLLIRRLLLRNEGNLFVCASAIDMPKGTGEGPLDTLERFCSAYGEEIGIRKVPLLPLSAADISKHMQTIFPRVSMPKDFSRELEQITQGNPLFLSEIVRKLVLDGKITLTGQQWVIEPLEKGYLPKSLEEIVRQKISALDEESRRLLDQASVFGDRVSLSMLTGSSEDSEAKILEFVDMAVSQGLISSDFQVNDETISFLSRRILEIAYGEIQKGQKQALHEKVGSYQESLFERDLLSSAATLAYHFKRSANREKALSYEQLQAANNKLVFNVQEAIYYTGEGVAEAAPKELPLDPESLALVPNLFRTFLLAVRNAKLYPPGSRTITVAYDNAKQAMDKILARNEMLTIMQFERTLLVNGKRYEATEFKVFAEAFLKLFFHLELKGITVKRDISQEELSALIEAFGRTKTEAIEEGYWRRFLEEKKLTHVDLTQIHYAVRMEGGPAQAEVVREEGIKPVDVEAELDASEQELSADLLVDVVEFVRAFLNGARGIKLYPIKSKALESAIDQVMANLSRVMAKRPALTLARVEKSLFVNGEKVSTSDFEMVAQSFLQFLDSIGLRSVTFLRGLPADQMKTFIGLLAELPNTGLNADYWNRTARERRITGILFDRRLYETRFVPSASGQFQIKAAQGQVKRKVVGISAAEEEIPEESLDDFLQKMPVHMSDLLLKGDEKEIHSIIRRLFQGYLQGTPQSRLKVISRCMNLFEDLNVGLQNQLAKHLDNPLLLVLSQEKEPAVLKDLANSLNRLATLLIEFGEYSHASRVLLHLHRRHRKLLEAKSEQADALEEILLRPLDPKAQQALLQDFLSRDASRQQNAVQLLGSVGRTIIPLLLNVIKREEDLRIRQLAASLLSEQGYEATKMIKREFVLQTTAEERIRILEVIDGVTRDLKTELLYALNDESPQVRQEALRLAERLNNDDVENILLELTESKRPDVAVAAIKSLAKLRPHTALEKVLALVKSARERDRLIACCQALGQIGEPACIDPLANILLLKGFLPGRKRHDSSLRAAAALALAQINDPRSKDTLAKCTEDRDQQVSQIARSVLRYDVLPLQEETHEGSV